MNKLCVFLIFIFTIACVEDDPLPDGVDCSSFVLGVTLQEEIMLYQDATLAYAMEPTQENCNAYKESAQTYIEALELYRDCATGAEWEAEYLQQLAQAEEEIRQLEC